MTEASKALDAVAALMRERQKYEQWMEALEAKRASSPAHVFERVMADYELRLREVMQRLGEHSPVLDEQARTLDARMSALGDDERGLRDRRAEAELRAAVGELSAEEWSALARESDAQIAKIVAEQDEIRGELAQVRELLAAATTPPRALTPIATSVIVEAPAPSPVPAAPADAAVEVPAFRAPISAAPEATEAEPAPVAVPRPGTIDHMEAIIPPSVPTPAAPSAFDELAFLESVAADALPPVADVAPGLAAKVPQVPQVAPATAAATVATPPSAPAQPAPRPIDPSLGIVVQEGSAANALAGTRRSGATPMAANVTGAQPIVIRSETSQTKTLKCTDCGAMNFPTEWYCERCGAELAAL